MAGATSTWTVFPADASPPGAVSALAVSGSSVYAGGSFTTLGNAAREGLAAIDASTGLANSWNPATNGSVYALQDSGDNVFAGGTFTQRWDGATLKKLFELLR